MLKFFKSSLTITLWAFLPFQIIFWLFAGSKGTFGIGYWLGIFVVAMGVNGWTALKQRLTKDEHQGTYNARWATQQDIRGANMVLGKQDIFDNKATKPLVLIGSYLKTKNSLDFIAVKPGHAGRPELGNFITVGPPGSGKGRAITTNLITYPDSTIVLDVKGENFAQTAGRRSSFGRVFCLHPEGKGHQYDPVLHMRHSDEALRAVANIIIDPSQDREPAFSQAAENALYAALLASRLENATTFPYLQALLDMGVVGFVRYLAGLNDPDISSALVRFTSVDPKELDQEFVTRNGLLRGAWGVLNTRCADFMTGGVMSMLSGNDFSPKDLYDPSSPVSIYLVFPESSMNATTKAFSLVVMSLMMGMIHYYDHAQQKPSRQVLLLLDEAGRIKLPNLWDYLATIRGRNIVASLYVQDLSQLAVLYGHDRTDAILANCKTQLFHPASHELTQSYVSRGSGLVSLYDIYYSGTKDFYFGSGEKVNEQHRPLITPDEMRQLHADQIIVFSANLSPILATRLDPNILGVWPLAVPPLKELAWERVRLEAPGVQESKAAPQPEVKVEEPVQPQPKAKKKPNGPVELDF